MEDLTAEDVERALARKKLIEAAALNDLDKKKFPDLIEWLQALPYYKPGNGQLENHTFHEDLAMFNASVFVDNPFIMAHQGDITTDVLRGLKKRLGQHVVYIFSEHNPSKPTCGPFDLTALNPLAGMAKPFGDRTVQLLKADVIIRRNKSRDEAIINENVNDEPFKRAGFSVRYRFSFEDIDEKFRVKRKIKTRNPGKALEGLGALFG